jgi:hypothetical protein
MYGGETLSREKFLCIRFMTLGRHNFVTLTGQGCAIIMNNISFVAAWFGLQLGELDFAYSRPLRLYFGGWRKSELNCHNGHVWFVIKDRPLPATTMDISLGIVPSSPSSTKLYVPSTCVFILLCCYSVIYHDVVVSPKFSTWQKGARIEFLGDPPQNLKHVFDRLCVLKLPGMAAACFFFTLATETRSIWPIDAPRWPYHNSRTSTPNSRCSMTA